MNIPELLAPAGNMENLKTAVRYGADAVYFGAARFSARAHAGNFDMKETVEVVRFCHDHGALAYVALNTLILNHEFEDLIHTASQLAEAGIDAFIVQDLGVAHLLHACLPHIPLHASTQMVVHNAEGIAQLAEWGFTRTVLARETSLKDMAHMHQSHAMELEVFVHGAQCVCYSGACFMSSFCGGRSGNRGDCAQPCRKEYTLRRSGGGAVATVGDHLLSPKDMDLLGDLPQLAHAGVRSLKIEGRMKNAAYVAATTGAYRWALDEMKAGRIPDHDAVNRKVSEMARIFNRGGFTTGYLHGNPGKDMMFYPTPKNLGVPGGKIQHVRKGTLTVKTDTDLHLGDGYVVYDEDYRPVVGGYLNRMTDGTGTSIKTAPTGTIITIETTKTTFPKNIRFYRTYDHRLVQRLSAAAPKEAKKSTRMVDFYLEGHVGDMLSATLVTEDMETAEVASDYVVQAAERKETTLEDIRKQLSRLGDTAFRLGDVYPHLDANIFIPSSVLNDIRRKGVALLEPDEAETGAPRKTISAMETSDCMFELLDWIPPTVQYEKDVVFSAQVASKDQAEAALAGACDRLILDLTGYHNKASFQKDDLQELVAHCREMHVTPVVTHSRIWNAAQQNTICKDLQMARDVGIEAISIQNIGQIPMAKQLGFTCLQADTGLNITNDVAMKQLLAAGIERMTLSPELSLAEMAAFNYIGNVKTALIVYGDLPLMHSEYCPVGALAGNRTAVSPCSSPCNDDMFYLQDAQNNRFDLEQDRFCRSYVFDHQVLDTADYLDDIRRSGIDEWRFLFLRHEPEDITRVLMRYRAVSKGEKPTPTAFGRPSTLGHLLQGVKH